MWVEKVEDTDKADGPECIVYGVAAKPDGTRIIAATSSYVRVYNAQNGEFISPLKGHKDAVYCVCYNRDGTRFASGKRQLILIFKPNTVIFSDVRIPICDCYFNESIHRRC